MPDLFEEKARTWDADEKKTHLASSICRSIVEHVALQPGMAVLDFGAGTGLIASCLAPGVGNITAVDTSQAMLDKLAAKPALRDKISIACQDIIETPLPSRFDLIVSAMAVHHVEDTARLLQTFHQHLNAEGQLALADLDSEDGDFHAPGTEGVYHPGFDRAEFGQLLEENGFANVSFCTAHVFKGETKNYPIFLATARKT